MTEALWQLSACDIVQGIRNKTFSCEEVMQSVVQRIAERNGSINAIVYDYSDEAVAQAQEADRALSLWKSPVRDRSRSRVSGTEPVRLLTLPATGYGYGWHTT